MRSCSLCVRPLRSRKHGARACHASDVSRWNGRMAAQDKGRALTATQVAAIVRKNVALTALFMAPSSVDVLDLLQVSRAPSTSASRWHCRRAARRGVHVDPWGAGAERSSLLDEL